MHTHTGSAGRSLIAVAIAAAIVAVGVIGELPLSGQGRGRGGGEGGQGRGGPAAAPLPPAPTAVALPSIVEITGPGPMFNSAPSEWPGRGPAHFRYETKEYWVSGTANGQPYRTRMVVRTPPARAFSGLVLMEAMHPSGAAHMFETSAIYTMSSGHAAVEVVVHQQAVAQFTRLNEARYTGFQLAGPQTNEILAQVGSLVRAPNGLLASHGAVRRMVLGGTSATAATLVGYLPAHLVYRTPDMREVFDGFLPTARADVEPRVNVPMILVPTMNEVAGPSITRRQDGDEGDNKFRVYEFPGMVHIDMRDNVRLKPNPCSEPLNRYPSQAYLSVALHHLLEWADKGTVPPKADRIWLTRVNGSMMALDDLGNPRGGVRNTYVDVPAARYAPYATVASPAPPNISPLFVPQLCNLGGYEEVFTSAKLRELYGSKQTYVNRVRQRLTELEQAGWSLPVYRDLILADANAVTF